MERVFLNTDLVNDNYFFLGYILGKYTRQCCPRYLKQEHFATLKKYIRQNKLDLFYGTLADRYREDMKQVVPPTYTAAIMLDHLDWMDDAGAYVHARVAACACVCGCMCMRVWLHARARAGRVLQDERAERGIV